jgi:hypothetical protein
MGTESPNGVYETVTLLCRTRLNRGQGGRTTHIVRLHSSPESIMRKFGIGQCGFEKRRDDAVFEEDGRSYIFRSTCLPIQFVHRLYMPGHPLIEVKWRNGVTAQIEIQL